jgi:hypothetical protein
MVLALKLLFIAILSLIINFLLIMLASFLVYIPIVYIISYVSGAPFYNEIKRHELLMLSIVVFLTINSSDYYDYLHNFLLKNLC